MRNVSFVFASLGIVLGLAAATPCHAQTNLHSYVSATGSGNLCTFSAPCADLATAVAQTHASGEISCLTGGSNSQIPVTITRSVTIDCEGVPASQWLITINAPGIVVTLRNMTISPLGLNVGHSGYGTGVDFQNGAALFIDHCVIEHWDIDTPGIGISFAPPNGVTAKLHVTDSVIKNNGVAASGAGIYILPSGSGSARVVIERTRLENNTDGIFVNGAASTGSILVEIKDSTVANNVVDGIVAYTQAGGAIASIVVDHTSSLLNGGNGVLAQGPGAYVTLTDSSVLWNATGLNAASGAGIFSFGNNRVAGNSNQGASPAIFALK